MNSVSRRQCLAYSVLWTSAAATANSTTSSSLASSPDSLDQHGIDHLAKPLAQDHVVVAERPSTDLISDDPALTKLPSGNLLATWTFRGTKPPEKWGNANRFQLALSSDDGGTWTRRKPLDLVNGMTFVHEGQLFLIGNRLNMKDIVITRSDDEGDAWLPLVTLFEGTYWNVPSGVAMANGQLYRAFSSPTEDFVFAKTVVVAADLSRDLLDPRTWRISNAVPFPGQPDNLRRQSYPEGVIPYDFGSHWLEPNVIHVRGRLMVLHRVRIATYATTNMCGVCDLEDDGTTLSLQFTQFFPMPGGHHKFHILYDEPSRLFWTPVNLSTDGQNSLNNHQELRRKGYHSGMGNERRLLMLYYSLDGLNWFQACCLAMSRNPMQSFMYPGPLIDGDDLLVLARTSINGQNQHDADLVTFHRLPDFRSLALPLYPELA